MPIMKDGTGARAALWTVLAAAGVIAVISGGNAASALQEASPAEAPPASEAPSGPLSGTARPVHYDLDLTIDPREERFGGTASIRIALDEAADGVWLHGEGLNVSEVTVTAPDGDTAPGSFTEVKAPGVAWAGFGGRTLGPGEVTVALTYDAPFDRNLAGLFAVQEQGAFYALAKSESIQARKFLPGFDQPGFKAPFDIALTIPEEYNAISNGAVTATEPAGKGMKRVSFATTRPLSTFLLSLAVGPFDVVERDPIPANAIRSEPIPLRGIARKGRGEDLQYILDITPDFMRIFEESLQQPYPYDKLDIIAAPQWPSGATELAAAITYREQRILAEGTPPPALRRSLISVHAHEIAHMWFGNLVTPPWWDDLWLKEGFATWGTPLVLSQWEPEGGHEVDAVNRALGAMQTDSLKSARAVREPITENSDIRNAYTAIPYSKGMAVIRMADSYFGPEVFRPALGQYISKFEDQAAASPAFFEAIGEATKTPALTDAFRSFVEQSGVPFITASLMCADADGARLHLKQEQYRPAGSQIAPGREWVIPITVRYAGAGGEGTARLLMRGKEAVLPLDTTGCPYWVHPNAEGAGYYRWTLSGTGWNNLAKAFDRLSPAEALSAVDSAAAAFAAGAAQASTALTFMEAAAKARNRHVVTEPFGPIGRYAGGLLDGDAEAALLSWAGGLYAPRLAGLSNPQAEDARLLQDSLRRFLALTVEAPAVREDLAKAAAAFVGLEGERDPDALDSDEYGMALTVGVQDLGKPFFDKLVSLQKELDDPRFEAASASAIGAVRDPELIAAAQDLVLSGALGTREAWSVVTGLFGHADHREQVWAWYKDNFDAILERIPGQTRRQTPRVGSAFCSPEKAGEVIGFFQKAGDKVPGHERQLTQTVERIALCNALKEQKAEELSAALAAR